MPPPTERSTASDRQRTEPAADQSTIDVSLLYRNHWRALVRLAILLVDDLASAEDVVQEAFVSLHRRHATVHPAAAVAYLRTSVVNGCRSVQRRRTVARKHLRSAEPDLAVGADVDLLIAEDQRQALDALRQLPARQQQVLVLRHWSNLSEREIAETLGISVGTVKSAASRGISALRALLEDPR